jgi:hypothetical protein
MGANATTSVPVYASGEVLTAANLNITNSGIPVFATTVTRDAAFGGTGEKTLAEGQFAYIEATNTTQYYDGAAWQSVSVTPGLVCVKAETALSGSSTTADGVFTSAYTNYRIVGRYTNGADSLRFQLGAATVYTTTNYNMQELDVTSGTVSGARSTSQASARVGGGSNGSFISLFTIELSGPQLAEPTVFQNNATRTNSAYTTPNLELNFGNQSASTAFDGIKFLTASGTLGGSFTIYGYSKTV